LTTAQAADTVAEWAGLLGGLRRSGARLTHKL